MENIQERIQLFNSHELFQAYPGLAEAVVQHEIKTDLKFPNSFNIPPFLSYQNGGAEILLGKIHKSYLFGMPVKGVMHFRLFQDKPSFKLFFTQMQSLGKQFDKEELAFWLTQVEDIEYNIKKIMEGS